MDAETGNTRSAGDRNEGQHKQLSHTPELDSSLQSEVHRKLQEGGGEHRSEDSFRRKQYQGNAPLRRTLT